MNNYYFKCRLCLEESNRNINIFKDQDFSKMIELLTGIKVDPTDGLPTNSCLQCHKEVKSAMLTRYQIINSHQILINELNGHSDSDTKSLSGLFLPASPNKEVNVIPDDKDKTLINNNLYNNKMESEVNNCKIYEDDKNTTHLGQPKLQGDVSSEIRESPVQNNHDIKNDDSSNESHDIFIEGSCDENDKTDTSTYENKNSPRNFGKVDNIETDTVKIQKQEFKTFLMKLRKKRDIVKQEITFRRKRGRKQKSPQEKIQFKKKASTDPYHIKVDYDIKPEHMEFLKTVGKKDRVSCPICQREMYGMNLKNHLITHNFDPVICDTCGKTSKNAQALQDHINYYHKTTPDRFMCDKCGKGYRVRFMLERHEKKEHGNGEKDYECTVCGKKFFEKLQLKNHINITHNKIKPFKCEHCGKDFGRRTQFVTHQLVHTKENRYHCQVCGKGFKIKQTMQTHLKGVHGIEEEKTIFCKICQKGFSSAQGLRAHVNSRVHGLEKCEHCSEFITFEYKDVHLREIHGIDTKYL